MEVLMTKTHLATPSEVSTGAAARILKVSQDTVTRLCEAGVFKCRRVGSIGWWRIDYGSLLDYSFRISNVSRNS
jgi:hypothetical protein